VWIKQVHSSQQCVAKKKQKKKQSHQSAVRENSKKTQKDSNRQNAERVLLFQFEKAEAKGMKKRRAHNS
jgi:hypothetical protein